MLKNPKVKQYSENKNQPEFKPGCTGKRRHRSAGDAIAFASRTAKLTRALKFYRCIYCHGYHLTTQVPLKKI